MRHLILPGLAVAAFAVLGVSAAAQPGQPDGLGPNALSLTSYGHWASQLMLEAQQLRDALTAAGPRFADLQRQAHQFYNNALVFYRQTRTNPGPGRERLRRDYQAVDRDLDALVAAVRRSTADNRNPAVAQAVAKLEYAGQQLGFAIGLGDGVDDRRSWLVRQTRVLDSQSDELLHTARELLKEDDFGRRLERDVRAFTAQVDRFRQVVESNAPRPQVEQAVDPVINTWVQVHQGLAASAAIWQYGELRRQGLRIGQLVQNVASALGRTVAQVPVPPIPPGPGPGPIPPGPRPPRLQEFYAVSADAGGGPHVRVFHSRRAHDFASFFAYDPEFKGGARVAVGDVTGNGIPDLITAPGPGMPPLIRIFDGRDMSFIREFTAFDAPYQHGCWVAAGDFLNNRRAEIVVGTGAGVPTRVRVFDAANGRRLADIVPYEPQFTGGAYVAVGDVNGDGVPDIITSPGPGRPVTVRIFDGRNVANVLGQFDAYDPAFVGGAFVAAANLRRDGRAEIVTGAGANGGPHVRVFGGREGRLLFEFFAYDQAFLGGVRVACRDVNGDGVPDIITTPGPGGPPMVRAFDGRTQQRLFEFAAFDPFFVGGAFVASR